MHRVIHAFVLRNYVLDPSHMLKLEALWVSMDGTIYGELFSILDKRVCQLRNCVLDQVKVQSDQYSRGSTTWEDCKVMCQDFPYLLSKVNFKMKFPKGGTYVVLFLLYSNI
jgi:hypothetical protein